MLTFHPMSIVVHGVALNITLQSYAGEVYFGLIADKEAVPHMDELTAALTQAFEAGRRLLVKAPGSGTPSARHNATANTRRKPAKKVVPATQTKRLATDAHAKVKRDATKNAGVRPSVTAVTKTSRT